MAQSMTSSTGFGAVGHNRQHDVPPMSEMNTTPLIDVMLVLLIMFIITVPSQTHQVEMALPGGPPTIIVERVKNELRLSANGRLSWNGRPISDRQLAAAL